jgi:hypothetical protein
MPKSRAEHLRRGAMWQAKYTKEKRKTHKRMCVWVPLDRADEFTAAVKRLERKWGT